ncbi:Ser-Thr-rich GPI-anchored membrane family protein [Bacteroidota bacterium]
MKARMLLFFLATFSQLCYAQSVRLTKTEQEGDNIIIWYDLEGTAEKQRYEIEIFGSHNDFSHPLSFTSGDVGAYIQPGENKKIVWNAKAELSQFSGNVEFKIEATLQYSPLGDLTIIGAPRLKRGKQYHVTWSGGDSIDVLNLDLYRSGKQIYRIPDLKNTGTYTWQVPSNVKPGDSFKFMMTVSDSPSTGTSSETFKIKRKIPRVVYVIPSVAILGVATYLIISDVTKEEPLPMPPNRPEK